MKIILITQIFMNIVDKFSNINYKYLIMINLKLYHL